MKNATTNDHEFGTRMITNGAGEGRRLATNDHKSGTRLDTNGVGEAGRVEEGKTGDTKIVAKELSYQIIGAALEIHKTLGPGFLEKVYENALMVEFKKRGIRAAQQVGVTVQYDGVEVGHYIADILVEDEVILEIKCSESIAHAHLAQTLNCLRATGLRLGLILNFANPRFEHKRVIL